MSTLVVYDTKFGNTEQLAKAIASATNGTVVRSGNFQPSMLSGIDLLVVGAPTQMWTAALPTHLFFWKQQQKHFSGLRAVAFDTGFRGPRVSSAGKVIESKLRELGCRIVAPAERFFVSDLRGPLAEGEADRAVVWVKQVLKNPTAPAPEPLPAQPILKRSDAISALVFATFAFLVVNNLERWGVRFVTERFDEVIDLVNFSIAVTLSFNLLFLVYRARPFVFLSRTALDLLSVWVIIRLLQVYPFDFVAEGLAWADAVIRIAFGLGIAGLAIRLILRTVRLARGTILT